MVEGRAVMWHDDALLRPLLVGGHLDARARPRQRMDVFRLDGRAFDEQVRDAFAADAKETESVGGVDDHRRKKFEESAAGIGGTPPAA